MAALVGDVIMAARELMPDLPITLGPPTAISATATTGGSLSAGTYYFVVTQLTPWGESSLSNEVSAVVGGGNNAVSVAFVTSPGATGVRVYDGLSSGGQKNFQSFSTTTSPVSFIGPSPYYGAPPSINRAYLPDGDGDTVSAFTLYRWLNEGLNIAAKVTGGIRDETGIAVASGQTRYLLQGQWQKITNAWYDGWPLELGQPSDIFQRTRVTGVSQVMAVDKDNDASYIELWPIASRSAAVTTLSGNITAAATTIGVTDTTDFLDHGMFKLSDNSGNVEIVNYGKFSGNNALYCQRGVGGTIPQAWTAGATLTELNVRMIGYRMAELYSVGDANTTLTVPPGWESILPNYLLSRFKALEQDMGGAQQLRQLFEQELSVLAKSNKPLAGPRQMGGSVGLERMPGLGGMGGGVLIP